MGKIVFPDRLDNIDFTGTTLERRKALYGYAEDVMPFEKSSKMILDTGFSVTDIIAFCYFDGSPTEKPWPTAYYVNMYEGHQFPQRKLSDSEVDEYRRLYGPGYSRCDMRPELIEDCYGNESYVVDDKVIKLSINDSGITVYHYEDGNILKYEDICKYNIIERHSFSLDCDHNIRIGHRIFKGLERGFVYA